jgi:hypothetical protein
MKGPQSYTQQVSGRLGAAACGLTSAEKIMRNLAQPIFFTYGIPSLLVLQVAE